MNLYLEHDYDEIERVDTEIAEEDDARKRLGTLAEQPVSAIVAAAEKAAR